MFEPDVFLKQMYCIEESTCDTVRTFRHPPQWFGAREIVLPQRYAPACRAAKNLIREGPVNDVVSSRIFFSFIF